MKQYIILLKKDFMELYRTKKILIIAFIFILFALASPILAKMTPELLKSMGDNIQIIMPEATIVDSYVQFISNISQICSFAMIIVFGGLIVKERKSGQYNILQNNGVTKKNFVLSKITTQILVVTIIYIISCLMFCFYNYVLFDAFLVKYSILSLTAIYIYLLFVISLINFYSVLAKSNIMSIVLSFSTIILIALFDMFEFGKYLPNYLLSIGANIFNDQIYLEFACKNILITLLLSAFMICISIKLCKNKD